MATDSSDRHSTQAMYKAQTKREASSIPIGPPSFSPGFQPKYSPVMTTPTPSAQTCKTPIGFLSACSLRYAFSSGRSVSMATWFSRTTSSPTCSISAGSPACSGAMIWSQMSRGRKSITACGLAILQPFDRDCHDHRCRLIRTIDEFDFLDLVGSLRMNGEIANLPASQAEGELRLGHIHPANVVREMNSILQGMILGL